MNIFNGKRLLKNTAVVFTAIVLGMVTMILLYKIPTGRMRFHVASYPEMFTEDTISRWGGYNNTLSSVFTDSLMINIATYDGNSVKDAMNNPYKTYENCTMQESLIKASANTPGSSVVNYPRYWHGYLLFFKPALRLFNLNDIRVISLIIQFFLIVLTIIDLSKVNSLYAILFSAAILWINPITTVLSWQFTDVICITLIAMIIILRKSKTLWVSTNYQTFFTVLGILVAFFDFLTYPLVACGVPLITALLIENKMDFSEKLKWIASNIFYWFFGYIGMWLGKWILASIITNDNIVLDAVSQILFRINGEAETTAGIVEKTTFSKVVSSCFYPYKNKPILVLAIIMFFAIVYYFFRERNNIRETLNRLKLKHIIYEILPFLLVGLLPFLWFVVVKNHSIIHPSYASKELAIAVWALLAAFGRVLTISNIEKSD